MTPSDLLMPIPRLRSVTGACSTFSNMLRWLLCIGLLVGGSAVAFRSTHAAELSAGTAKVDITRREAGPVNDPLYVKALVMKSKETMAVLITVDAVAIGEIGYIKNDYLPTLLGRLEKELGISANQVLVNASHCHGVVCSDVGERTFQAVKKALQQLTPVTVGAGVGHEDRVMENRRLKLKSGMTVDVRHAYSLPPDDEIAEVGPVDPQIGVLRLDRLNGIPLAVVYNFACHPIQGVPSGGNTADISGFASSVIEQNLEQGAMAFFVQGCGGDINPVFYKDVNHPRNAETLGNLLGLSTLKAVRKIECKTDSRLQVIHEKLALPRGDRSERIFALQAKQKQLLSQLKGTSLNFKTLVPLMIKHNISAEFPSYDSHRYLHDDAMGRLDLRKLDAENRRNIKAYLQNIYVMEELTRVQTNLALLRKHQASLIASGKRTIDVDIMGLRIGDFVLITFPGELTVQIGLNIKQASNHRHTFVAGYTNGYIYYAPTAEQLKNVGGAQEDSDCILAAPWQELFEKKVADILKVL